MGEYDDFPEKAAQQQMMLEQLIKNQIEVKDEMIDKLHKELAYYREDAADRFTDQLMKAVIKIRKDMNRLITSDRWDDASTEDVKREYRYIFEDITDLLEQQNIDSYQSEPGETFDASLHQPRLEATEDAALDRKVKISLSEGYKKGDKVLVPERVIVYQYRSIENGGER